MVRLFLRLPAARARLAAAVLTLVGAAAYATSFSGAFQFDDVPALLENPTVRRLWPLSAPLTPPSGALTVSGRPLLNLSFAVNYALSGYQIWSYHALNLAIHLGAGLVLAGLIRRTVGRRDPGPRAELAAILVAGLWLVHPATTEAVTYVVQRAESLSTLWYLLTLYAFVRGWRGVSVLCCALGMATKEIVVSAPLAVLLYDRAFLAETWRQLWTQRRGYYAALAGTWLVLAVCLTANGWDRGATTGFGVGAPWWPYWVSQGEAVVRYLALAFWPASLAFDYGPPTSPEWLAVTAFFLVLAGAVTVLRGAVRGRAWAFAPACALLVLAPTSLVPGVLQFIAEHRAYLPLAAVLTSVVVPAVDWADRKGRAAWAGWAGIAAAAVLAALTLQRNLVYADPFTLWSDTVRKRPQSPTAQANLAQTLLVGGRLTEALPFALEAVRLDPRKANARYNLGRAYEEQGRWEAALTEFRAAADLNRKQYFAAFHAGVILQRLNRPAEAEVFLRRAVAAAPELREAELSLGILLAEQDRLAESRAVLENLCRRSPDFAEAQASLALVLDRSGETAAAIGRFRLALQLKPAYAVAHYNLGNALLRQHDLAGARAEFAAALQFQPGLTAAREMLERVDAFARQR